MNQHSFRPNDRGARYAGASQRRADDDNALTHIVGLTARLLSAPWALVVVDDGVGPPDMACIGMSDDVAWGVLDSLTSMSFGDRHEVVISTASSDLLQVDLPDVAGEQIRFVAGISIVGDNDAGEGWIWVLDTTDSRTIEEPHHRDLKALAALLRDELEMRQSNRRLKETHRERAIILKVLPDALVFADPDRHITTVNDAFSDLFGYSADEARGRTTEFLYAQSQDFSRTKIRYNPEAPDQTEPYQIEYRRADGSTFLGETIGVHVRDDHGQTLGYLGITRDVTEAERLKRELNESIEQLRRNEKLLRETNRMAKVGGGSYDVRTDIVTWSDELYRIHDLPIGQPLLREQTLEYFEPEERERLFASTERVLELGEHFELELPMTTAIGRRKWVRIKGSPIVEDDEVVGIRGYHQDITAQKQAAEAKREFISVVSHELRTPLTSIRGMISLVANEVTGELPDEARQMLTTALKNTERLGALIDDILDIEKIDAGKIDIELGPIVAEDLIDEVFETSQQFAQESGVALRFRRPSKPIRIYGDEDKLHQVLINLLSNAIKYSPPAVSVDVSIRGLDSKTVRIAVEDQGPGIPEEFRDQLFEKFTRADTSDQRHRQGTGLGLSIARRLTEEMGGRIGFDTTVGQGTTMFIDIPAYEPTDDRGRIPADDS